MSRSIRWLFAMLLLLPAGIDAVASTKDYTWLLFLKVNEPPVVDAGLDQTITWAADSVYLDATVSDDPRDTLKYTWTKLDDPDYEGFGSPNAEDTTAKLSAPGTYIFQLSVSDGKLTSNSTVAITLSNNAPTVNAGTDQNFNYPTLIASLKASASDDPQDTLSYLWSKVSGPGSVTFSPSSAEDTNAAFLISGIYTLQLVVSDGDKSSSDQVKVTINNSAPIVDVGLNKQTTAPDNSVYLNAMVSDSTSGALTYAWSKISGPGTANFSNPLAEDTNVSMSKIGTYVFKLRVSDGELASTDTVSVEYLPAPAVKIDVIVAVGDSITVGYGDDDCVQGNAKACSGYTPLLRDLLPDVHTIFEEGTGGQTSAGGLTVIQSIINNHPYADQYLVMYGTNDSYVLLAIPSGQGLNPGDYGYAGSFKDNMQRIINAIKSPTTIKPTGAKPVLAKAPYAKDSQTYRNTLIRQYNTAVDELVAKNSIGVSPPDFYEWFYKHQDDIRSWDLWVPGKVDDIHPKHDGYVSMSYIWRNCLLGYSYNCTAF